jgi:hypothetical protein
VLRESVRGVGASSAFLSLTPQKRGESPHEPKHLWLLHAFHQQQLRIPLDTPNQKLTTPRRNRHIDQLARPLHTHRLRQIHNHTLQTFARTSN